MTDRVSCAGGSRRAVCWPNARRVLAEGEAAEVWIPRPVRPVPLPRIRYGTGTRPPCVATPPAAPSYVARRPPHLSGARPLRSAPAVHGGPPTSQRGSAEILPVSQQLDTRLRCLYGTPAFRAVKGGTLKSLGMAAGEC